MSLRECASCTTAYAADLRACPQCQCTDVAGDPSPVLSLPTVVVECNWADCPDADKRREVRLKSAGVGVLLAPPLLCARCGSAMWTVKPWSPPLEAEMAKITRHGGPTNARAEKPEAAEPIPPAEPVTGADATSVVLVGEHGPESTLVIGDAAITREPTIEIGTVPPATEEGGEGSSVGSSSKTSPERQPPTPKPKSPARPRRVRTTASRSRKARTGGSSASSTDGGQAADTSEPDGEAG